MRGDARWQSRDARPGKALPSILITDKWVIWSLPRFIGFDEKPWSTVISLPIQPLLWSISFDGKPCITMDIPLIPSLLWSIGFDGKPWSTVDVFARPAITVVHRFYNWVSLWVLNPLCSLHAPPPNTVRVNPQKGGIPGQFQLDFLKSGVWTVWFYLPGLGGS